MAMVDLTARDVAAELQVSLRTVHDLCARGMIPSYRAGASGGRTAPIRVRRKDLDAFKDNQQNGYRVGARK